MLSSSVDQTAEIDFEIAVHLGEFKNIDLSQKGIYAVRVRLLYGQQRRPIMPTGLFSAPSSLDSQTNEHQIPATRFITGCEVDDSGYSCTSRSMMIRYRGEKHELNDGVCWRLTLSNLSLPSDGSSILCPEHMFISLELLFNELKGGDEFADPMKLYSHPDEFIPDDLNFAPVSSQLIALQQITSGFHQYYPVTFTPEYFVEMDMMIHGCITSIRYQNLSFLGTPPSAPPTAAATGEGTSRESTFEVQDNFSSLSVTSSSSSSSTQRKTRLSTTIDSTSSSSSAGVSNGNTTAASKFMSFFTNPEKLLFSTAAATNKNNGSASSSNAVNNSGAPRSSTFSTSRGSIVTADASRNSNSNGSSGSNKLTSQQQLQQLQLEHDAKAMATNPLLQLQLTLSLTRDNVQRVFDTYSSPLLANYRQAVNGSRIVLEHYNNNNSNGSTGSSLETQVTDNCVLEASRDHIVSELLATLDQQSLNTSTTTDSSSLFFEVDKRLSQVLTKYIHICNEQLTLRWALLNSAFRRALPPLKQALYEEYRSESRIFWKQQQIVHTRPYEGSMHINSTKDDDMLMILNQHIAIEREREQQFLDDTLPSSSSQVVSLLARGQQIFDYRIFRLPSRLPYLLIEQYADFRTSDYDSTIDNKSRRVLIAGTESATLVEHVIFLQHGFLGSSFDMRLLSHALSLVAPKTNNYDRGPVLVYACTANEGAGNVSITTMGKSLAVEIKQFLQDKASHLLASIDDKKDGQEPLSMLGRISFIGHSLGGLMIRSALEEPELRPILSRLHILMTIATPHLGNLFSDSQLVSTGMWALYTLKKYPALNELVLDDNNDKEKTILYRLSENSSALSRFKRVILVSSPKDQYVSTYSARLQITPRIEQDQKGMGAIVKKMMTNITKSVKSEQLVRVTMVNNVEYASYFATTGTTANSNNSSDRNINSTNSTASKNTGQSEAMDVNNVIGRAAHICYLENDVVALQLVEAFEDLLFAP